MIISLRGVEKKSFLPRRDRGYFMRAEDIWRTLLNARRKLLAPCHSRAVNTELGRISRDRCHLPQANYMKLRLHGDSIPSALTILLVSNGLQKSILRWNIS